MNDKMSQEDIDKILNAKMEDSAPPASTPAPAPTAGNTAAEEEEFTDNYQFITSEEADTLGEISNIFMGSASTTLSMLLGTKVEITTPKVWEYRTIGESFVVNEDHIVVSIKYTEGLDGTTIFALKVNDSAIIANLMMGGDGIVNEPQIGEIELSAVSEAMNQMVGTASTALSSMFNTPINISAPSVKHQLKNQKLEFADDILKMPVIVVKFKLIVGTLIDSEIIQIMNVDAAKHQVGLVMNMMDNMSESIYQAIDPAGSVVDAVMGSPPPSKSATSNQSVPIQQPPPPPQAPRQTAPPPASPFPDPFGGPKMQEQPQQQVTVQPVQFASFDTSANMLGEMNQNLNLVMDVRLELTVELGRSELPIKNVLELTKGSIVELDKVAGEPVELYANGKLIAKGEVVVIEDNFGLRITSIVSPETRMKIV